MKRTLAKEAKFNIDEKVLFQGWAENVRAMGKLIFIDLRDRTGVIQCVANKENFEDKPEIWQQIKSITQESVIAVTGKLKERDNHIPTDLEVLNANLEVSVEEFEMLNKAAPLPIPVRGDGKDINENARLDFRYLDLRRKRVQEILRLRGSFVQAVRNAFYNLDFLEVETPILTASTKEGARDFVVPSRMHPGTFYALPQSPQQYKQLLMAGGIEKYFQIARCVRDEDLRADRGFEHTQIDIEMSFVKQEDVHTTIEKILSEAIKHVGGKIRSEKFEVFTYDEVLKKFGDDKFDIRTEEEKKDGTLAFAWVTKYPMFKKVDSADVAEVRDGKSGWTFTHNPFSGIKEEHQEWHRKGENIEKIEATQYDLVCNGYEIGSGSIRNHDPELLRSTFKIMGYSEEEVEKSIGHMLKAFELGTPPHGGIALGVERLVMLLTGEDSLKETIAFPMTYNGHTAVMKGPNPISKEQLDELGLQVKSAKDEDSVTQAIKDLLDSQKLEYEYSEHEPTPTSEDASKVRGTALSEAAKSLILKGKRTGKNYMVVVRGDKKLDTKAMEKEVGEAVEFEKPDEILKKFGIKVGGVPPFGNILGLPLYFDESILENENVSFSCGKQTCSATMASKDLEKVLKPVVGNFGK